ncbi:MAG TPA: hypothetical protein VN181_06765 [Thermoanaerobaculia bacterium]|nr:hypothetical protein [Thermoanaerobaculia bacterium]
MKKMLVGLVGFLIALPVFGAVQYEFFQKSTSDSESMPPSDMNARALVEGDKTRVDVISGNVYPPGTYVISTDGSRRLFFVDPTQRTYTEFNVAGVTSAIGTSNIIIENLQSSVQPMDQGEIIAGVPTRHYRVTFSYDITVVFRSTPLKQSVRTVIDKWTTTQFGDIGETISASAAYRTGNPKVDEVIELETRKIQGFPLRQSATITTTNLRAKGSSSELKLPATRVMTREMRVTSIRETKADAAAFIVPLTYQRAESAGPQKPQVETITFEPPSK